MSAGNRPGPDAGLEHATAAPAEANEACPDRADDELRGEVRILRRARERGVVRIADGVLQLRAERLKTSPEFGLAWRGEYSIGEFAGAEAHEANEPRLLGCRSRALLLFDFGRETDRRDIVARALLPIGREAAIPVEHAILAAFRIRRSSARR